MVVIDGFLLIETKVLLGQLLQAQQVIIHIVVLHLPLMLIMEEVENGRPILYRGHIWTDNVKKMVESHLEETVVVVEMAMLGVTLVVGLVPRVVVLLVDPQ